MVRLDLDYPVETYKTDEWRVITPLYLIYLGIEQLGKSDRKYLVLDGRLAAVGEAFEADPVAICALAWADKIRGTNWSESSAVIKGELGPAIMTEGGKPPSLWAAGEAVEASFGWVEKTTNWGRPCAEDLFRWPSLLAKWRALPIAAAAAKCCIIRSSSSDSLALTGNCNGRSNERQTKWRKRRKQ